MLTPELKDALSGEMTPKFLATLDAEGRPNCVPVISIAPWDDTTLVFGEFFMNKSRKNLLESTKVGVAVLNDKLEGWSLKGTFLGFETTGPHVEWINQTPLFRYNAYTTVRSAGSIRVEEVSEKFGLSKTQILSDFLRVRMLAPFFSRSGRTCMPRRVYDKFQRMQAVRAMTYRDRNGYPRTFPLMACIPTGANRLMVKGPLLDTYRSQIPADAEVAIAIITPEPIAYQVKGRLQGRVAGCSLVGLTECYSASPPLLGERLDTMEITR